MNKVLVDVYCPITNRNYDIYVLTTMVVYEVKILMAKLIESTSNNQYFYHDHVVLCDFESGSTINNSATFDDLMIKNGYKFLLI